MMHEQIAQALLTLYSQVAALKMLPRLGWLQRGVAGAESVADHTFGVAMLALLVGDRVETSCSQFQRDRASDAATCARDERAPVCVHAPILPHRSDAALPHH